MWVCPVVFLDVRPEVHSFLDGFTKDVDFGSYLSYLLIEPPVPTYESGGLVNQKDAGRKKFEAREEVGEGDHGSVAVVSFESFLIE